MVSQPVKQIVSSIRHNSADLGGRATTVIEAIPLIGECILSESGVMTTTHATVVVRHSKQIINQGFGFLLLT
jgi:hypothetical protein